MVATKNRDDLQLQRPLMKLSQACNFKEPGWQEQESNYITLAIQYNLFLIECKRSFISLSGPREPAVVQQPRLIPGVTGSNVSIPVGPPLSAKPPTDSNNSGPASPSMWELLGLRFYPAFPDGSCGEGRLCSAVADCNHTWIVQTRPWWPTPLWHLD